MNLKYYLRGLGIGIVVTALIMGIITGNSKETLSNEEIKERARALGMIEESTVLGEALATSKPEPSVVPTQEPTQEPEETEVPIAEEEAPATESTAEPTAVSTEAPTPEPEPTPATTPEPTPTIEPTPSMEPKQTTDLVIEVKSGEGSYTVCEKLEEAGLIASASEYDRFLYENGYDKQIRAGIHEIPADADTHEIARILAGKN